ncbi:proprotein convertase P-domain-containing protein [Pleionea sediminis]|uniref:proprotein convertase P-domain-containing protein n=1 Tax=Pleionea sediminis TaxID=2569479 RepID=UPI0011858E60|nr:proprotein convertase P-domain-containing protein [Pleionea sediminis]
MLIKRFLILLMIISSLSSRADLSIAEKDLALIFPIDQSNLILTTDFSPSTTPFPLQWYNQAQDGFANTLVGDALYYENYFSDWAIVSIRMVPCSTFQVHVSESNDTFCWPEVRLVWQPILYNFELAGRRFAHYADDRAFHTLYHIPAESFLSEGDAANANALLEKAKANNLNAQELEQYTAYSRQVSRAFLNEVVALRDPALDEQQFQGVSFRPETLDSDDAEIFYQRLKQFLVQYAKPENLKALTAFSLPEGRQPALIGEWVFLSFKGENGDIEPTDIIINDHTDGAVLANLGPNQRASARRDDDKLYEEPTFTNVMDTAILFTTDFERLSSTIADRSQRLVPNTSCASCHKLNQNRFDFHNLSYLQDRTEMTISPRVIQDVVLDMQWVAEFLNSDQPELPDTDLPDSGDSDSDQPDSDSPDNDTPDSEEPPATSKTFLNDTVISIPDNNSNGITSVIEPNDIESYSQATINLSIQHTYRGDLKVRLISPLGREIVLHNRTGKSQDDLDISRVVTLSSNEKIGAWQLLVSDHVPRDVGRLIQWSLKFE